jgi:hypothetical protein
MRNARRRRYRPPMPMVAIAVLAPDQDVDAIRVLVGGQRWDDGDHGSAFHLGLATTERLHSVFRSRASVDLLNNM